MAERMAATPGFAVSPLHAYRYGPKQSVAQIVTFALAAVLFLPSPSAASSRNRGAELAALCAACHRLDGKRTALPSIVGRRAANVAAAMQAFRSGKRPSQIMHAVALSLSENETAMLAHYLARRGDGR